MTNVYDNSINGISCLYNGYELNTSPHKVLGIDAFDTPKVLLNKYQLSRSDGEIITNKNFGEKTIIIEGRTQGTDYDNLQANLDTLKSKLVDYGKNIDIVVNGATRRYTGAVSASSFDIHQECVALWKITFACTALGIATSSTGLTFGTYTSASTSYTNSILGSYKTKPTISFTINQVKPWWEARYIEFENAALNQRIRLTRTWNWFDQITINGDTKVVTLYPTTKTLIDECESITGWTSGDTLSLETTNMIEGDGCFKVVMAAGATSSYVQKLNSAVIWDMSSTAGKIIIPIFIPTPTSGTVSKLRFQAGSDATLASNYKYWEVTTQWDSSAIATNAWNYFLIDLSTTATNTTGTPVMTTIKSIQISVRDASNFQLNGWRMDYTTINKSTITGQTIDYEGTFPDLGIGSSTIIANDELDSRNITITGNYVKRYL